MKTLYLPLKRSGTTQSNAAKSARSTGKRPSTGCGGFVRMGKTGTFARGIGARDRQNTHVCNVHPRRDSLSTLTTPCVSPMATLAAGCCSSARASHWGKAGGNGEHRITKRSSSNWGKIMKALKKRASAYACNFEIMDDDGGRKNSMDIVRESYIAGTEWMRGELTRWRDPKVELPEERVPVQTMAEYNGDVFYDVDFIINGEFRKNPPATKWRPINE